MAKKTKRKVSSVGQSAPVGEPVEVTAGSGGVSTSGTARPSASGRRITYTQEFNPDYSYVKSDLKRIGVLAGSFFILLVALAFIMPLIAP